MAKKLVGVRRGGVTTMFTGTPDTASLNMLIDKKPAGSTASVGAYIGATRSGDVSAFDALGSGPLALDVNGVETATAPLSAMLAGTTALTVPDTIDAIMKLRWGSGTNAVYSDPATIVAAPAYAPNIVLADRKAVTKIVDPGGTAQNTLVSVTSFNVPTDFSGSIIYEGSIGQLRVGTSGQVVCKTGYGRNDGTTGVTNNYSSSGLATADTWIGVVSVADVAKGTHDLYAKIGTGPLAFISSSTMTDVNYIGFKGRELRIGYLYTTTKFSGVGFWETGGLPAGFDPVASQDTFFMADGRINNPIGINELLGAAPTEAKFGKAASWTNLENEGTAGPFTGLTGGGVFEDVAPVSPGAFITTSDTDADLASGAAANYTLTQAVVESFGTTDYDYSMWSVQADRSSILLGESTAVWIDGPSEEQKATWGFVWSFGTAGEFKHIPDLPWHMRQKNRAVGHQQTIAWSDADGPGDKIVKVHVIPPAYLNTKGKTLTLPVTNRDPEVEFSDSTWYIDPLGTWPGSKVGWNNVSDWNAAQSAMTSLGRGRILFRRGQTYDVSTFSGTNIGSRTPTGGVMVAAGPGVEALPVMNVKVGSFNNRHGDYSAHFFLVKDIAHAGGYDVVSGVNAESRSVWDYHEGSYWSFHGCEWRNMQTAIVTIGNTSVSEEHTAVWDCHITDWENYGIWVTATSRLYLRGNYIAQNPMAPAVRDAVAGVQDSASKNLGGPINHPDHGSVRCADSKGTRLIIGHCQFAVFHGWSMGSSDTDGSGIQPQATQPILRIFTTSIENGFNLLINENYSEGGGYLVGGGSAGGVVGSGFGVVSGNYHLAHANWCKWSMKAGGLWVTNNVQVVPDTPREDTSSSSWGCISYPDSTDSQTDPTWAEGKINIFGNTLTWMLSGANIFRSTGSNPDVAYSDITGEGTFVSTTAPDCTYTNNIIWSPNKTLTGEAAPRVPDGIRSVGSFGPTPMYRGRHFGPFNAQTVEELLFNSYSSTPAGAQILPTLSDTSSEVLEDSTLRTALDFFGRIIPSDAKPGAIQPQVLKPA